MSEREITLGGGCFWCLEAVFEHVQGVTAVESGYCNGHTERPSYEQVCSGQTGHAEVVRLRYDEGQVSLRELLEIFFTVHDPTSLNHLGNDVGTQYRSGIYFHDEAQAGGAGAASATAPPAARRTRRPASLSRPPSTGRRVWSIW